MKTLDFYYDIVCPYAYLASTHVEALARAAGVDVRWKPMLLGGVFRAIGAPDAVAMPPAKVQHNLADMRRWADVLGVPLSLHPRHPRRSVEAMRLLNAVDGAERIRLTHALYRAYFVEHRNIDERQVLRAILGEVGLDPALESRLDEPALKDALRQVTDEAVADGVFGAPGFVVGDGVRRTLFWGQDRMHLVARALGAGGFDPAASTARGSGGATVAVDFWFDFSSPYAYLGSTQIEEVAARHGAQVRWRPFLLGALFKSIGTPVVPIQATNEPKRRYLSRDVHDWADWWQVPFSWPTRFPMRTVLPLRVVLAVDPAQRPKTIHAIFRAFWVEDRDIADPAVLTDVLSRAGLDASAVDRAAQPGVKDALKALTDEAVATGLCGAPTSVIDGHLFWGQDRLGLVERALSGWSPPI
jgi:2-hydroxychromene-2-carboxylate isomerase